jgi:hypothetical protein
MPRPLSIALIATLCIASNAYAIDKTPAAMKRVIDKAVAEVKKNRQDFEKANQAPLEEAKEELQDLAKKFIEESKTEEAQTVLRQVKSLDADVLRMAKAPDPVEPGGGRGPAQKPLLERLAGKWDRTDWDSIFRFHLNGTAEAGKDDGTFGLRGRIAVLDPDHFDVAWDDGWRHQFLLDGDVIVLLRQFNPEGRREGDRPFAHERIK